jgi:hypothetical protein
MQVSTEAKLFAVRQKLLQAERNIYECNKILAFVGDGSDTNLEAISCNVSGSSDDPCDPVTGLYPGQQADPDTLIQQEDDAECLD